MKTAHAQSSSLILPRHLQVVDCKDTFDLRRYVAAVMEAENWILERIPPDQKIVIIAGEEHRDYMHGFLWQALIKAHAEQQASNPDLSFSAGYEKPHNQVTRESLTKSSKGLSADDIELVIRAEAGDSGIFAMAAHHNVPIRANDIDITIHKRPVTYKSDPPIDFDAVLHIIDQKDPFSRGIVEKYRPDLLGQEIVRASSFPFLFDDIDGIELSNCAMMEKAASHMKSSGSRIYMQHCGRYHAAGFDSAGSDSFSKSLTYKFQDAGFHVLPLLPVNDIPQFYHSLGPDTQSRMDEYMVFNSNRTLLQDDITYESARQLVSFSSKLALF